MKMRFINKGECWKQHPLGSMKCPVCQSESIEVVSETDNKTNRATITISCSCGMVAEMSDLAEDAPNA